MKFIALNKSFLFSIVILIVFVFQTNGQNLKENSFNYISPKPGSKYIMPENNIALRHGDILDNQSIKDFNIEIEGSKSGKITGNNKFSDDGKTIIFLPDSQFKPGERVFVTLNGSILTISGKTISADPFWFDITEKIPDLPNDNYINNEFNNSIPVVFKNQSKYTPKNFITKNNNLPDDFPDLSVEVMNEANGNDYYFVTPFGHWGWFPENVPYLIIFDDYSTPIFYRKLAGHGYDFKKHSMGKISHFLNNWPNSYINVLDSSYNNVDFYTMQNGYITDFHEFLMLPNGHVFVEGYDPQIVDMSQIVPGGNPEAIVSGWIIQEQDASKNVVFQWRSWDHLNILDADEHVDLTAEIIDPFHGNSIEVTPDNALLLSPRNLNEITKVDRNTGEIIWRLSGNNNMFEFIDDTLRFSRQHDCRILDNGNISIFDNGTYHPEPQFSSIIEYELDEELYIATLVKRRRNDPDIFGTIMGSGQKAENGNYVAGWGSGIPGITEFDVNGNIAASFYFAGINYRAYRHNWKTNRFYPENDTLEFGYLWMEETKTKNTKLYNDQDENVILTSYFSRTNNFVVENEFPITIPANGSTNISITILPDGPGTLNDIITFNSDINSEELVQRIAQQITVIGHVSEGQGIGENSLKNIIVYPNPVKNNLIVKLENESQSVYIKLFDAFGKLAGKYSMENNNEATLDMSSLSSGLYFMQITDLKSNSSALIQVHKQ